MSAAPAGQARGRRHGSALAVWWRHCRWALRASSQRLLARPFGSAMTVAVLGLAWAMPLALWLLLGNVQPLLDGLGSQRTVSVFMQPGGDGEAAQALAQHLRQRAGVLGVSLKSPDQGMAELAAVQGFGDIAGSLDYNPLPWVVLLQPAAAGGSDAALQLAAELRAMPGVDLVQDNAQWHQRMDALMALGRRGFALLAGLLVLAMLMVVGQTVRQDVRSRADEIAVLQLAGASARFVRRPYLYAGALYGLGAGVLAVILVVAIEWALAAPAQALLSSYGGRLSLRGLDMGVLLVVPLAAALLGWLGARIATRASGR